MTIQIGENKLAISRTGDFEAALLETTGCSLIEHVGLLASYQTPFHLARVIHPMLIDPVPINELSAEIDAQGADAVRADLLAILTDAPRPSAKVAAKKKTRRSKPRAKTTPPPVKAPPDLPPVITADPVTDGATGNDEA